MRCAALIVRPLNKRDYDAFRTLFEDAYAEYLGTLRLNNPQQYQREQQERRKVTHARFNFYLKTGSSFLVEENGEVIGYVASQTVPFMHGFDRLLWIEYIVVRSDYRRKGVGTTLLCSLIDYAKRNRIDRVYTTINPDNEASIKLHMKAGFNVKSWKIACQELRSGTKRGSTLIDS